MGNRDVRFDYDRELLLDLRLGKQDICDVFFAIASCSEPAAMARAVTAWAKVRVCAALIRDRTILMVRHVHDGRDYWTLPGGGVEAGETLEQAVLREVQEETNLSAHVVGPLYQRSYRTPTGSGITEHCFLLDCAREQRASLGDDPELDAASQWLTELAWRSLDDLRDDIQVARVLAALADAAPP